jgi:hypothetical protein
VPRGFTMRWLRAMQQRLVMLLLQYPMLRSSELVGTDLVQAIPLVASAAGRRAGRRLPARLTASLLECSRRWLY